MKKRIIFVNRYFWPDHSATSQLLTELAPYLDSLNVDVYIVCSRLYYSSNNELLPANEVVDGIHVHRTWSTSFGRSKLIGRAIDYFSFYFSSFIKMLILVRKGDVLVAKTDPPLISVFAALVTVVKQAKLIIWLQDVFPEIAKSLNVKAVTYSPLYSLLKHIRNWSLNIAMKNVVIGDAMKEKVSHEIKDKNSIKVIHNWVIGNIHPIDRSENYLLNEWDLKNKFVVGYSGNLGRAHDYESIFDAIKLTEDKPNLIFLFIGGGAGYDILKSRVKENKLKNVIFKPYQNIDILSYSLSIPNIHLVSLEESLEGLIVPSKFYGVLASGRPIIIIGNEGGDLSKIVKNERLGKVIPCGKGLLLASTIMEMKNSNDCLNEYSSNCKKLYINQFDKSISMNKWKLLMQNVFES